MSNARNVLGSRLMRRRLFSLGAATLLGAGASLSWPVRYLGRIYPGTTVFGLEIGGLSRAEATTRLKHELKPLQAKILTFRLDDRTWAASASDLGLTVNYASIIDRACRHGRDDGALSRYGTLIAPTPNRTNVPIVFEVNEERLSTYFDRLDADIAQVPQDARLGIASSGVTLLPETMGIALDRDATRQAIMSAVRQLAPVEVIVSTRALPPRITTGDLEPARVTVDTLLQGPITVFLADHTWTLTVDDLSPAVTMPADPLTETPSLDPALLGELLAPIAWEMNYPPVNATVAWDGGLYTLTDGAAGAEVDLDHLVDDVATAALGNERSVELPLTSIPPAVDGQNLESLGITERLAAGDSSFAGSTWERATNVEVAAYQVSQALIPPGGVFSFNESVGPITLEQGYVEGKIISGDWFASDLGGGVCQVSTTVYRAALLAGLPFAEWHPHTFRLGFYELDGWSPGIDAAIYQPNTPDEWALDLRFTNPTDAWMLLQLSVDSEHLSAALYGAITGYAVDLSEPDFGEQSPVPEPIERPTPDLQPGEREQVQIAQPGIDISITRWVTQGDVLISEDTFYSPYQAQADVYLVGTEGS